MGFRDRFKKKKAIIERKEITIVGAGAEGTALTIPLSAAHIINLYARNRELANSLREKRENETYLPGIKIPDRVRIFDESTTNLKELWARSYCTIFAVPSYALRPTLERFEGLEEEEGIAVAISKGIESETLCPPLDILRAKSGKKVRCVFISFVGFARDTAEGVPVTGVLASKNKLLLNELATVLNVANLQILKSRDETGVQLGSALKNVYAIVIGMLDVFTKEDKKIKNKVILLSLKEATLLVETMGGDGETLKGASFLGDLILSVNGPLGRNYCAGRAMALLDNIEFREVLKKLFEEFDKNKFRAEGLLTAMAAFQLSHNFSLKLPILEQVHQVIFNGKLPQRAMKEIISLAQKKR